VPAAHDGLTDKMAFYQQYRTLIAEIEETYPVHEWRVGDVDVWPLVRMEIYLDMHSSSMGDMPIVSPRPFMVRLIARVLCPLLNLWRSRSDLAHWIGWPRRADVVFLGDGVSLDRIGGAWRDSFAAPLADVLEKRGEKILLMQRGGFGRLPWQRPTFAANIVEAWGWLLAWAMPRDVHLPQHAAVVEFLTAQGIKTQSLQRELLIRRAAMTAASARIFECVLCLIKPRMAFVVGYFTGLGPAFVLACRKRNILCIDLQRAPQEVGLMAYGWKTPGSGYNVLPDLFWTWTERDAANTDRWALPRHAAFHGGDIRLAQGAKADKEIKSDQFQREILVALQPIGGHRADWDSLARQIAASPANWRWWIRRHPASTPLQDVEFGQLLALNVSNVMIDEASVPLLELLPHMDVVLSMESGTAVEAALLGVPALFLSPSAQELFAEMIVRREAKTITIDGVTTEIVGLLTPLRDTSLVHLDLEDALRRLDVVAAERISGRRADARRHPERSAEGEFEPG
jgi:hypothetical protein